jgi:hypothetical protein
MIQTVQQRSKLSERSLIFFHKFKEYCGVRNLRFKMLLTVNLLFEPAALLELLLRLVLIVPEIRLRGLRFNSL